MILNKITDKQKTSYLHVTKSEILTIDWGDGKNLTFYAFDKSKKMRIVDKEYFGVATVGSNYKKIEEQLLGSLEDYCSTRGRNGSIYFCTHNEGVIYGFDKNADLILKWSIEFGEGHPVYDIKFQAPDFLWLAFPTGQTVTQVSISEQKPTHQIGEYSYEDNSDLLSYPESIFVKNNTLLIPNMGNNKLFEFDLLSKHISLLTTFDEKIWQYTENKMGIFLLTDSGIYEIESLK